MKKFDMYHCISLRYTAHYFDIFIYCSLMANVVIIILHNYNTIFLSIFIILAFCGLFTTHFYTFLNENLSGTAMLTNSMTISYKAKHIFIKQSQKSFQ